MRRAGSDEKIQDVRMYKWVQNATADCGLYTAK